MKYRRVYIPDACYFFTVVISNRKKDYLTRYIDQLRHSFQLVKHLHPFEMPAVVILPDHLHCIWQLPSDDANYSQRWRLIKSAFTRSISSDVGHNHIWQKRFWEHTIRDQYDFDEHVAYIHSNPVKHGYVDRPDDWQYSSYRKYFANDGE